MMRNVTLTYLWILLLSALLVVSFGVAPASAEECCTICHGSLQDVHGDYDHNGVPSSGVVAIFADDGHDDAGWHPPSPYFGVQVDCGICHTTDLPKAHGNDCATCHPTPYDSLGHAWNGGCQQGGCHATYHDAATTKHAPFEDPYDPANDCSKCHQGLGIGAVTQSSCLNCHDQFAAGDVTPPVTTIPDARATYYGAANIDFKVTDNGKVGVGRTFYKLDGSEVIPAGKYLTVQGPGQHTLEYWSKDQSGNTESPSNTMLFEIVEDSTPPTTTSDALPSYLQGATIRLTATDNIPDGVRATYYRLNGGPVQTYGTSIVIPATPGTINYTLSFWSEDWAGNIETENSVAFTVTSGGGVLRLVWGSSDTGGSPCPDDPEANAAWTVRRGGYSGPVVASGSGSCPGWSGVNDIPVQVNEVPYFVTVDWWNSAEGYDDQTVFANVLVSAPGQVIRLSY